MTNFPMVRRATSGRYSAVLVLTLVALAGCGLAGGETRGAGTAPAPVPSSATAVPRESTPTQA
ncbi:hypothetical protein, partial [Nonomuraea sp. NPDC049784]|uniref:hypothetical protein n=1 Tax=Nonomuraea sp. NPDC049784 TaxID=3154361 RepID=UPI00340EE4CC